MKAQVSAVTAAIPSTIRVVERRDHPPQKELDALETERLERVGATAHDDRPP